jgi:hypothetical protein
VTATKTVSLGALLSMSTGVLLAKFTDLHAAIECLAGGPVWTHQLPDAVDALRPELIRQHPWLDDITVPGDLADEAACAAFLAPLAARYGDEHPLAAAPSGWSSDPVADLVSKMGGDLPVVVNDP